MPPSPMVSKILFAVLAVLAGGVAAGCAPALVGGAVTGGAIANDERTAGSLVEDEAIELKIKSAVLNTLGGKVHVEATSYDRNVLLTGQTPSEELRRQVLNIARATQNVREVYDEMEIAGPISATARASDLLLTARVKTNLCLLQTEGFSCLDVKVVTEHGVVYLLGIVNEKNLAIARETARSVPGVLRVSLVFQHR